MTDSDVLAGLFSAPPLRLSRTVALVADLAALDSPSVPPTAEFATLLTTFGVTGPTDVAHVVLEAAPQPSDDQPALASRGDTDGESEHRAPTVQPEASSVPANSSTTAGQPHPEPPPRTEREPAIPSDEPDTPHRPDPQSAHDDSLFPVEAPSAALPPLPPSLPAPVIRSRVEVTNVDATRDAPVPSPTITTDPTSRVSPHFAHSGRFEIVSDRQPASTGALRSPASAETRITSAASVDSGINEPTAPSANPGAEAATGNLRPATTPPAASTHAGEARRPQSARHLGINAGDTPEASQPAVDFTPITRTATLGRSPATRADSPSGAPPVTQEIAPLLTQANSSGQFRQNSPPHSPSVTETTRPTFEAPPSGDLTNRPAPESHTANATPAPSIDRTAAEATTETPVRFDLPPPVSNPVSLPDAPRSDVRHQSGPEQSYRHLALNRVARTTGSHTQSPAGEVGSSAIPAHSIPDLTPGPQPAATIDSGIPSREDAVDPAEPSLEPMPETPVTHASPGDVAPTGTVRAGEPPSPAAQLIDAALQRARVLERSETTFELSLSPEELGPLRVRLERHDGGISIHVTAASAATQSLLEAGRSEIQSALASLDVGQITIDADTSGTHHGPPGNGTDHNPSDHARGRAPRGSPVAGVPHVSGQTPVIDHAINVLA